MTAEELIKALGAANQQSLQGGALGGLLNTLVPRREPIDPALLSLIGFTQLASGSSRPGATVVGAGTEALGTVARTYLQDKRDQEKSDIARASLGVNLLSKLNKGIKKKEYEVQGNIKIGGIDYKKGDNLFLSENEFDALPVPQQNLLTGKISKASDIKIMEGPMGNKVYETGPNAGKPVFDNNNQMIDYSATKTPKVNAFVTSTGTDEDKKPVKELNKIQKENVLKLSKEYLKSKEVKDYQDLEQTFNKVLVSYDQAYSLDEPKVADLSMIFAYMKMLDPRSVVREGEQQQARSTSSMFNYLANLYNSLLGEGTLTDTQRKSFRDGAYAFYDKQIKLLELKNSKEKTFGQSFGIDSGLYTIQPTKYDITGYNVRIPRNIDYDAYIDKEDENDIGTMKALPDKIFKQLQDFTKKLTLPQLQFMLRAQNVKNNPVILFAIESRIDELLG